MKTRNAGVPKQSPTAKKTPPARKSASKAKPSPSIETPETVEMRRTSAREAKQVKKTETTPVASSNRRQSSAEEELVGSGKATPGTKAGAATASVGRRTSARAKTPASVYVSSLNQPVKPKGRASSKKKKVDINDVELAEEEVVTKCDGESAGMEERVVAAEAPAMENAGISAADEEGVIEVELDPSKDEEDLVMVEEFVVEEVVQSSDNVRPCEEVVSVDLEEYGVEKAAKFSESLLPCDEEKFVVKEEPEAEEVAKSPESVPPGDEDDHIEREESVVEKVARSSENEPPCDEENPVVIETSIIEDAKTSENDAPCDLRQSVLEVVARNSENEPLCAEEDPIEIEQSVAEVVTKSSESRSPCDVGEGVEVKDEQKEESKGTDIDDETYSEPANKVQNDKVRLQGEDTDLAKEMYDVDEKMEEYGEKIDLDEHGEEELPGDDAEDHEEETVSLQDERKQLTAITKERKTKKEREIFIDGLDPDVEADDVRRVFERIGGIVEVRLQKNPSTTKNKGYAYVEFKDKEHARRALSEMKNPSIRGKRCGTAPSEDNTTLFIGNICNTWTKETIKQKLKDYEVEGIENINLVPDIQHEGLSRGFAFVEFSCHGDAMLAYKRIQQPDVIFGHPERTAKVGFAEPLCEPDPEVMAQVKSIFVDGLPPHWDEKQVREQLKSYGEILRVVLARNMSTAKRKDFGFVDFSSHESAVACVNIINNTPLDDGNIKIKVKARLSNPLPKTQAVKGGIRGGFRIGCAGSSGSRFGRDSGRSGHSFNQANSHRDRHFYDSGRDQSGRMGFNEHDYVNQYKEFSGRGSRRGFYRGGQFTYGGGSGVASQSPIPYVDRSLQVAPDRGRGMPAPSRRHPNTPHGHFDGPHRSGHFDGPHTRGHFDGPHTRGHFDGPHMRGRFDEPQTRPHLNGPQMRGHVDGPHMGGHFDGPHMGGHFVGPHMGSHFDEPSFYDERDRTQGMKRPFHMREHDPVYLEPSRQRPRLNYNDPTASFRGNHYSDTYGAGSRPYPHESYGPESHYGPHSSYYGPNQSYGGRRYY